MSLQRECVCFRNEEKLRAHYQKEIDEIKRKYEQTLEKQGDKLKLDLDQIDKLAVERKLAHDNEKQKVCLFTDGLCSTLDFSFLNT